MALGTGQRVLTFLVVFMLLFTPFLVLAQPSFVGDVAPACGDIDGDGIADGSGMCQYCDLMPLAERIIEFLIFFGIVVAILVIIYAGWLYLTAGSNAGQITTAHSRLRAAIFGLIIVLAAWLIIELIVSFLVDGAVIGDPWILPGC